FSRFLRGSIHRSKTEFLRALPLVFRTWRRHHYGEYMQTPSPGWSAPKSNEAHISSDVRPDTVYWRTDAPGVVSQDAGRIYERCFYSLHRSALCADAIIGATWRRTRDGLTRPCSILQRSDI